MKKSFLLFITFLPLTSLAVDYSKEGTSNPYKQYKYSPLASQNEVNYFSNEVKIPTNKTTNSYNNSEINKLMSLEKEHKLSSCWTSAGKTYGLDPWLLMAYAKVESSFNPKSYNINKNKTVDLGLMQINSFWIPTLKKYGINPNRLLNPCDSVFIGAWIAAQNIRHFGYNIDGIGAYNSPKNQKIRRDYGKKVILAYHDLVRKYYLKDRVALNIN